MLNWARFNIALTVIVITLGALTRLLDAGLGCPDWPGCYGRIIPPLTLADIAQANQAHPFFPVEHIKAWSEMIHRFGASLLGFSLLSFAVWVRLKPAYSNLRLISYIALSWVIVQGLFGMLTVTLRIWPPVVTLHLLAGMIMLAIVYWQFKLSTLNKQPAMLSTSINVFHPINLVPLLRPSFFILILITLIQIGLGGWTSAHYAGLACPDLPLCQGQWWPDTVHGPFYAPLTDAQQYLGGLLPMADRMAIQILHRANACLLIISAVFFCYRLSKTQSNRLILIVMLPLLLQVFIGISNVYWLLPLPLALLHNSGAALFWLCLWHVYFALIFSSKKYNDFNLKEDRDE